MFGYSSLSLLFFSLLFLNDHCIFFIMELSWKKSYSLVLAMALGGRAWSTCSQMKEIFQTFVQALPASPLSIWGDSHLIPALRVRDPNVGSTLLIATKTLSEKSLVIKWNLQLPASVRSFQSPRGTVQCSLHAHYKPVNKQLIYI